MEWKSYYELWPENAVEESCSSICLEGLRKSTISATTTTGFLEQEARVQSLHSLVQRSIVHLLVSQSVSQSVSCLF
jgi:hypothetical protein